MTQIILIRHGQSANNALPEHQRVCDPELTELGVKQAALTAAALHAVPLTGLYCSPFVRSAETIRPLAETLRMNVSVRSDLFEQGGCYSGHEPGKLQGEPGSNRQQLTERYPTWKIDERIGAGGWWGRPYESLEKAEIRASQVVAWIHEEFVPSGGVHLLVIHADFKRLLLAAFFAEHSSVLMPLLGPLHNAGITRLSYGNGDWKLLSLNATTHLPAGYVT